MDEKTRSKYVRTYHVTATTTPGELCGCDPDRTGLLVYNNGDAIVYILGSKTTEKADGIPVAPGRSYENTTTYGELWQVADSGSQDLRVEEDTD
jgi:hypothetical protein